MSRRLILAAAIAVVGFSGIGLATAPEASASTPGITWDSFGDSIRSTWAGAWGQQREMRRPRQGDVVEGVCRIFEGKVTVYACVPASSPDGGSIRRVWEDSSARYTDGYVIDAEDDTFHKS